MTNKMIVPGIIVLLMLAIGILFCVWRRTKSEYGTGLYQIIRVKKNNKGKGEAYVEETEGAATDSR